MDARDVKNIAVRVFNYLKYEIRTHVVCQVVSYDADSNTLTALPVRKSMRTTDSENETSADMPTVSEVPVHQIGSGKLWCTVAPAQDSYGTLHLSDRILDDWKASGGIVEPSTDLRCHSLSDGIFHPSELHLSEEGDNGKMVEPIKTDRIEFRTRSGKTEIAVLDDESVLVKNDNATVTIDTAGNIEIDTPETISVTATGNVTVETDGDATVTAGGDAVIENSSHSLTVGAASINADNGTDFVAMATKVDLLWTTLYTLLATWVPVPMDGGAAFKAAAIASFPTPPTSVASGNLKAE